MPEDPEVEEPFLYVNWVYNTTACGDNCRTLELIEEQCQTAGYITRRYMVNPCAEIPPPPMPACTPTGHGEGIEGYEYECDDKDAQGEPIDNDCDGLPNCEEARCRATDYCKNACDLDGDQVKNPSCGGNDCDEQSQYRASIPVKQDGVLIQERDQSDCNDGRDNDCDGAIDYPNDSSCPPPPTPTPTPSPDPNATPDNGGGGDNCPCGNCESGCDDGGGECQLIDVEGQCYAGVDYYDSYGVLINSDPPYCDPPTQQYYCP